MGRYNHPNQLKYIKAPTVEQIKRVIDAYGVDTYQFGRFFSIGEGAFMWHIMNGVRQMPVKHWHIIYECLKLIDQGKELPVYKEDIPKIPDDNKILSMFKTSKKKRTTKKHKVKRTGALCELC